MANHKSAAKRARQAVRRNERNTMTVSALRTSERKVRTAIASGDKPAAESALKELMSRSSRAATKGAIHAKTAARKVSRLSQQVARSK